MLTYSVVGVAFFYTLYRIDKYSYKQHLKRVEKSKPKKKKGQAIIFRQKLIQYENKFGEVNK